MDEPIPRQILDLFWDAGEPVDPERHVDYVLGRVLEHGGLEDVQWLLSRYGAQCILEFVRRRGANVLSARTANFWLMALGGERWDESYQGRRSLLYFGCADVVQAGTYFGFSQGGDV